MRATYEVGEGPLEREEVDRRIDEAYEALDGCVGARARLAEEVVDDVAFERVRRVAC